jgi:hypothetical protein
VTIYYRRREPTPDPPEWFDGWVAVHADAAVCHRDTTTGAVVGIANPVVFNPSIRATWTDLGDGWEAYATPDFDPRLLIRHGMLWADTKTVRDMNGRDWAVPVVLTPDGSRAFRVAYGGRDMLPRLTPIQTRCLEVAAEARAVLVAEKVRQADGDDSAGLDMTVAARWALPLIAAANHIPETALSELGLTDDFLIVGTLAVGTGLPLKR